MKKVLFFGAMFFLIVGCTKDVMNPDIEAVRVSPLGFYIIFPVAEVLIDSITFTATNSQDAHMIGVLWEFYDTDNNLIYAKPEPFPLDLEIKGLVNPAEPESASLINLIVTTDTLSAYMFNNDLEAGEIRLRFISQADYFPERMDTTEISVGIERLFHFYFSDLKSDPEDSIPINTVCRITATAKDIRDNPVTGGPLEFTVSPITMGTIEPPIGVTGNDGTASVFLFAGGTPGWAWVTVYHEYAGSRTMPIKFYIPAPGP